MEENPELTRIALVHMITGFVLFLGMGLLGYSIRLDQAGFWTFDPSLFYEILTLHGAGMRGLNGSAPLDARYLWTGYVATIVGGVGAGAADPCVSIFKRLTAKSFASGSLLQGRRSAHSWQPRRVLPRCGQPPL